MKLKSFLHIIHWHVRIWSMQLALLVWPWLAVWKESYFLLDG